MCKNEAASAEDLQEHFEQCAIRQMQEEGQWMFVRTDRTPKVVWVVTCGYPEDGSEELYVCRIQTNSGREWLLQKRFSEIHALFAEIGGELPDRTQSHFTTTLGSAAKARALTAIINPASPKSQETQLDNIELFARKEVLSGFLQASVTQLPHFSRSACDTVLNFLQDPTVSTNNERPSDSTEQSAPSPVKRNPEASVAKKPWFQSNTSPVSVAAVNSNPGVMKTLFSSSSEQALTKTRAQMIEQDGELADLRSKLKLSQAKLDERQEAEAEAEYKRDLEVAARGRAEESTKQRMAELEETVTAQREQLAVQLEQLEQQAQELWKCRQEVEALAPLEVAVVSGATIDADARPSRSTSAPLSVSSEVSSSSSARSIQSSFNSSVSSASGYEKFMSSVGSASGYESDTVDGTADDDGGGSGKNAVYYCVLVTKGYASWKVMRRYSDFR
jgi:hypothetical protein